MDWFNPSFRILLCALAITDVFSDRQRGNSSLPETIRPRAIPCIASGGEIGIPGGKKQMPLLPGWGHYHFEISSSNDSAKIYFDQGLNLYYSYHARESAASFKTAASFDSSSAMCYWGQALAEGPFFNALGYYSMPEDLPAILDAMSRKMNGATKKEQDLILAMLQRYLIRGDEGKRKELNRRYAESLKSLMLNYPQDLDIRALYIDAVMLEHPWDFWYGDGRPKPWTPELIPLCEEILRANPLHPGAMHYYIHLTEASRDPGRAAIEAKNLRMSMPGVAHMVHMASHVYERSGQYENGVEVNDLAHRDISLYDSLVHGTVSDWKVPHYLEVQAYCALNGAIMQRGKPIFDECKRTAEPAKGDFDSQTMFMIPILAWTRMGYWDSILASPSPGISLTYCMVIYDFARGLACLRKNDTKQASRLGRSIDSLLTDPKLFEKDSLSPFSPKIFPARVARNILQAEIFASSGNADAAERLFNLAVSMEDSITYSEPKDWMLPARQYFGNRLLEWKRPEDAEKIFREDLIANPGNGWSLTGLCLSLLAQQKKSEAAVYAQMAKKSFSGSDLDIKAPVF